MTVWKISITYTVFMHYALHWLMLNLLHLFFYKTFFEGAINFVKTSKRFHKMDYELQLFVYKVFF